MEPALHRNTWLEINTTNICYNIKQQQKQLPPGTVIFAVVKANGYGHGAVEVARTAIKAGAKGLCVAVLDEALSLRAARITVPILVLAPIRAEDVALAQLKDISVPITSAEYWQKLVPFISAEKPLKAHLVIDSGMGRIGVRTATELSSLEQQIRQETFVELEGVFTHFATADQLNQVYFNRQLRVFEEMVAVLKERPLYVHCSNSATALLHSQLQQSSVRLGIGMYGLSPSPEIVEALPYQLRPALSLYSQLIHVKWVEGGETIGYGATYTVKAPGEWIGTIPIGYADGWLRDRTGSQVIVADQFCEIVGRVCMDQCMIRLPQRYPLQTKVTLIGQDKTKQLTADDVAHYTDTINYEIICLLSDRIPRVYTE
ncbi:alanine racemase [Brochothrix campestris]|uniref:Alanine racemase n=1 Tax=Brochothrix campestris FSL F6-1037 TaxID=1265861 RepID=W7CTX3_9LIST|nr:alanine racemase [Brochothrix campestris]EUJ40160.1 alanine racemase [Brochothrix campestris FSL F6-1037]